MKNNLFSMIRKAETTTTLKRTKTKKRLIQLMQGNEDQDQICILPTIRMFEFYSNSFYEC